MAKKKTVPVPGLDEFAALLMHRVRTAEVKTASPSRAQTKIQVRIAWTDPDGKPGLGYCSVDTGVAEQLGKKTTGPNLKNFFDDVFRTDAWARNLEQTRQYHAYDWSDILHNLHKTLQYIRQASMCMFLYYP